MLMRKTSLTKKTQPSTFRKHWRISALVFFVFCLAGIIIARLFFVQVLSHDKYQGVAEGQRNVSEAIPSERGEIFLRDSTGLFPLSVNREYFLAYAVPGEISDKKLALDVGATLGIDGALLEEKFSRKTDPFEVLKHRLSDDDAERVRKIGADGIYLLPEFFRYYPGESLASHVVGFVGMDEDVFKGQYGIEASFDEELKGKPGFVSHERDAAGRRISLVGQDFVSPEHGVSIVLTIERVIQYEVEKILREALESFHADGGTIIVLEPETGNILAMASNPSFNPNEYSAVEKPELFLNPAISFSFEPGSTMKPITMAIGIEEGKVNPSSEYVDTGSVQESGYTIRNAEEKVYGRSTMTDVLENSINTGVIFVEKLVGNDRFRDYLKWFGFGSLTGVSLPAEISGNIKNLNNHKRSLEFFTASFGQGISVTPLQLANAYATLANDGVLMKPRIVDRIIFPDGRIENAPPEEIRSVVNKETARLVGKMLRSVVVNGHGKRADVPGYAVVGKTGTAQVVKSGSKEYEEGMNIGSFVGYAPLDDPKFVVLVKIDNPRDVEWAESSAAPTFGKVMRFLLESSDIKPTENGGN